MKKRIYYAYLSVISFGGKKVLNSLAKFGGKKHLHA